MSGAVLCPRPLVERLKRALTAAQLQDRFEVLGEVEGAGAGPRAAVLTRALAARAFAHRAALLEPGAVVPPLGTPALPAEVESLLQAGQIAWAPGWRRPGAPPPHQAAGSAGSDAARFRFVELFAGIGGFRVGLESLGGRCVLSSEIDSVAADCYADNFGERPLGDIAVIPAEAVPPHEILTAGFPCQSFSAAGNQRALGDTRGQLYWELLRLIAASRPAALLLENVPNILRLQSGHVIHQLLEPLRNLGYNLRVQLLSAAPLLPQERVRAYIVGFRTAADPSGRDAAARFRWPSFASAVPRKPKLSDVLEPDDDEAMRKYTLTACEWASLYASAPHKAGPQRRAARRDGLARTLVGSHRGVLGGRCELVYPQDSEPAQGPVAEDEDCGKAPRFYTERECARLQGFPDSFRLEREGTPTGRQSRAYKLLGNAVCPPLIAAIATQILGALNEPAADSDSMPVELLPPQALRLLHDVTPPTDAILSGATPAERLRQTRAAARKTVESSFGTEGDAAAAAAAAVLMKEAVAGRPCDRLFCEHCSASYTLDGYTGESDKCSPTRQEGNGIQPTVGL